MVMKSVSVAQLKSRLSQYLAAVKNGQEVTVTSHRHPIAKIVPLQKTPGDLQITPAKKPAAALTKIKGLSLAVDLLGDLLADRRRR